MSVKQILIYPFRRAELLIADIYYNNVKLLLLKEDDKLDEYYWDWIETVEKWKKGKTTYKEVEKHHDILAAYTQGAVQDKDYNIKDKMKQKVAIHG